MKVLIVNKSDVQGGAARAAYRLHVGLQKMGVDSRILVDNKVSDDPHVYGPYGKIEKVWGKARSFLDKIPLKFYDWQRTPFHVAWIGKNVAQNELIKKADIINLHWITEGFLSIKDISKLAKLNKLIVWTLHDMWAFTGGCHYSEDCEKYINQCGSCPRLNSTRENDITRRIWKKKKRAYKNLNLTIVTPSKWLAECAKRSSLLSNFNIEIIPNGLNTDIFKPIDKVIARNILNLPKDKKIILFGAMSATTNRLKGFHYLKEALIKLQKMEGIVKDDLLLMVFGVSYSDNIPDFPFEAKFLGRLCDDFSLTLVYNAADVFALPSIQDNLPNTALESISCGTPVVGFNIGGIPDIIDHKVNGYLAEYKNPESLAEGIKWVLEDENRVLNLRKAAREKAIRNYCLEAQAKRYLRLYEKLLYIY